MEEMKNRVYGVVGIKSIMSNWNADFSGEPRTNSDGKIFGSDKAFKYPIKKMWEANQKNKVLNVKSYKVSSKGKDKVVPRTLGERFSYLFGKEVKDMERDEIIKTLFSAIDVLNFGATFAENNNNISITGAVQIGQGYNKYSNTNIEYLDILSPFSSKEGDKNSTIGNKIVSDEAHYMYPFSVNPSNYDIYKEALGEDICYTKEAYKSFKEAALMAATAYNTNSKVGCENEFAIFVECKEESKLYLANLDQYIEFKKSKDGKDIIDLSNLKNILNMHLDQIENIDVYYNDYTLSIEGIDENYKLNKLF